MQSLWQIIKGLGRLFKVSLVLVTTLFVLLLAATLGVYLYFSQDLPNIQNVSDYHPYVVATVYGHNKTPIGEFWSDERRLLTEVEAMPPLLISAFLAAEDARFFEHRGIDFRGTLRALIANWKAGSIVQGGSTITQQVTRSLLLSRQKTYTRKIKEAILATRLERALTKGQILYLYLNQIFFGNRAYGVRAAAQNYFHKELSALTLAEMALLAGLPRAPASNSPFDHPRLARGRQLYVLERLHDEGVITAQQWKEAQEQTLTLYRQGTDKEVNQKFAPHFTEYLRQYLLEKYGPEKLYRGGLSLYTTIDPNMQRAAQEALQRGLEVVDRRTRRWRGVLDHVAEGKIPEQRQKIDRQIAAEQEAVLFPPSPFQSIPFTAGEIYPAVVLGFEGEKTRLAIGTKEILIPKKDIDWDEEHLAYTEDLYFGQPAQQLKKGDVIRVRALEGGRFAFYQPPQIEGAIFAMEPATGLVRAMVGGYDFARSEFNRAMTALRQPGSAFKPFIYAAALDKGYTFQNPIADTPFAIPAGPGQVWAPKNYDGKYRGLTTVHNALVHSYNVATARIGYHIRLDYLTAYIRKLGITTPIEKYPSMTLGANGVHLHEMVASYSTFVNGGVYRPPVFLLKVIDGQGQVLEAYSPPPPPEPFAPNPEELNTPLFTTAKKHIETDGLELFPSELKVLYGSNIPPGHVMTPQTAALMVQAMHDVVEKGTGFRVRRLGKPAAGKTGTTNETSDTWFIGFVPDLACGVWVGYDQIREIGKGEQGGKTAAPIFLDFMQRATAGWEAKEFKLPPEVFGKNWLALSGGSSIFAEYIPMSALGLIEGGNNEDTAADFLEMEMEGVEEDGN